MQLGCQSLAFLYGHGQQILDTIGPALGSLGGYPDKGSARAFSRKYDCLSRYASPCKASRPKNTPGGFAGSYTMYEYTMKV